MSVCFSSLNKIVFHWKWVRNARRKKPCANIKLASRSQECFCCESIFVLNPTEFFFHRADTDIFLYRVDTDFSLYGTKFPQQPSLTTDVQWPLLKRKPFFCQQRYIDSFGSSINICWFHWLISHCSHISNSMEFSSK